MVLRGSGRWVLGIDEAGRETLSRKEGAKPYGPGTYTPRNVVALLEEPSGMTAPTTCLTYLAPPSESFDEPDEDYERIVRAGYKAHGLSLEFLEDALADDAVPLPLFVYGTMMRNCHRHDCLAEFKYDGEATVPGRLLRGPHGHPCLVPGDSGETVHGEMYLVDPGANIETIFGKLDDIEGFHGFDGDGLFQRRVILARDAEGGVVHCWAYHWMRTEELPVVEGGRWREA
jgi:gamma-glutamylcyclotransferase (GGCT)/AIG2-like uncharacterized protein YtfP